MERSSSVDLPSVRTSSLIAFVSMGGKGRWYFGREKLQIRLDRSARGKNWPAAAFRPHVAFRSQPGLDSLALDTPPVVRLAFFSPPPSPSPLFIKAKVSSNDMLSIVIIVAQKC